MRWEKSQVVVHRNAQTIICSPPSPGPRRSLIPVRTFPTGMHAAAAVGPGVVAGARPVRFLARPPGDVLRVDCHAGVRGGPLDRPRGHAGPRGRRQQRGEVELVEAGWPAEAVGGDVVGDRGALGGGVGAEPEPLLRAGDPDLRHPLAPLPPPHPGVSGLLRRRAAHPLKRKPRPLRARSSASPSVLCGGCGVRVLLREERRREGLYIYIYIGRTWMRRSEGTHKWTGNFRETSQVGVRPEESQNFQRSNVEQKRK